ncbi:CPK2 [Symbiodinium natans]|uniref:CPK2 protein n=1 Tax=Symbiodinium natans TaxID=878477 RepID=A0A812V9W2_9DINO|nr:CPK2 [Symbiodinium natans]
MALHRFAKRRSPDTQQDSGGEKPDCELDYTWTKEGVQHVYQQHLWAHFGWPGPSASKPVLQSHSEIMATFGGSLGKWLTAGYLTTTKPAQYRAWTDVCPQELSEQFFERDGLLQLFISYLSFECLPQAAGVSRTWRRKCRLELGQVERAGEAWCSLNGRRHSGLSKAPFVFRFFRFGSKERASHSLEKMSKYEVEPVTPVDFPRRWKAWLMEGTLLDRTAPSSASPADEEKPLKMSLDNIMETLKVARAAVVAGRKALLQAVAGEVINAMTTTDVLKFGSSSSLLRSATCAGGRLTLPRLDALPSDPSQCRAFLNQVNLGSVCALSLPPEGTWEVLQMQNQKFGALQRLDLPRGFASRCPDEF